MYLTDSELCMLEQLAYLDNELTGEYAGIADYHTFVWDYK